MDKLEFALMIVALGFSVVMVILFILYMLIILFGRLLNRPPRKEKTAAPQGGDSRPAVTAGQGQPVRVEAAGVRPAVVAAAMAAVYSCLETAPGRSFVITVAPRSKQLSGPWALDGRKMMMDGRTRIDLLRRLGKGEKV